jgi:hypothetical protein
MKRLTEEDHRWFIEDLDLDRTEKFLRGLVRNCELGYEDVTGEDLDDYVKDIDVEAAFKYLRRWRAEMLECMASMLNARNPEKIALAKIFIQAGIVKAEDLDGALNAPGIHKVVAMYPDGVGE